MRIEDLDEFQGMTPQMVREWLESHGWVQRDYEQRCAMYVDGRSTVCWVPNDFNADTIYGREQRQTMTATMVTLALRENRTVQAMLREINPRMRKGMPSGEALSRHDRWIVSKSDGTAVMCRWRPPYMVNAAGGGDFALPEQCKQWKFWPCDEHGNKVRWPTDSEGKML